jgi:hypothetical protein
MVILVMIYFATNSIVLITASNVGQRIEMDIEGRGKKIIQSSIK